MPSFHKSFACVCILILSTVSMAEVSTQVALQDKTPCTETKVVEQSCANPSWAISEGGKPFIAERIVKSSSQPYQHTEAIARDTAGRVRNDEHILSGQRFVSSHRDVNTIMELEGPAELTVGILDCFGGKSISLRPGPQTAVITQSCPNLPPYQPSGQPYSYKLTRFLSENTEPNVSVEDLGYKQIQEFKGRGVRITWRGTEKDGAWNGKPAKVWEEWMSDDLGVTLLWVYSDLTKGIENRATLRGIRREEPDASLFTVPSGYKIDYWK